MTEREITRRSLLLGTASVAAGGMVRPGGALATLAGSAALGRATEAKLFEHGVGTLPAGSGGIAVDLRRNADLLGVRWSGAPAAHLELRVADGRGGWSRWVSGGSHGHAPDGGPRSGRAALPLNAIDGPRLHAITGDPVWIGGGSTVQLRSDSTLREVRLSCVDVSDGLGARRQALAAGSAARTASLALATTMLSAGAGQPPIVARRAWAQGMAKPRVAPEYGVVRMAFVHHTDNPNGYSSGEVPAMLRAIYAFHRFVNGWNDIGYNFVIDLYGRIFEGRAGGIDEPVIGAHAGGYNYASTGVAMLGEFSSAAISAAAAGALERLLAWKLSLHGVPTEGRVSVRVNSAGASYSRFPAGAHVSLPRVAGHRDGDSTDCPGEALYAELPPMRSRIHALAGSVARVSIALSVVASAPGGPTSPSEPTAPGDQTRTLEGVLRSLDGNPVAGAPIEIQTREVARRGEVVRERALGQVSTDPDGRWSLPVTLAQRVGGMWLRALCPRGTGVPATVSAPLHVAGVISIAPAPTPVPAPAPTPPATESRSR